MSKRKTLGISKLEPGSGEDQLLDLWNLITDIIGMSFDTTSSNTGSKNGACTTKFKPLDNLNINIMDEK